ncbi:elongator complex protein 6 [Nicotiana tabacum]|uniref:Elongator complex protein 6 n=2 Tax=Nicotiana TaxID=4085 RepID=A0A1S4AP97_TOBAC|nr:PREDICTED: elongator complex protein 6 [Nicotiana sylvestris]XP_016478479.1 PREDICTED: elongator complex protein 6-like [Nicotiana tabacum]
MDNSRPNLLEEALVEDGIGSVKIQKRGRVVVVEDCVETSAAFVLHHFLKRSLQPDSSDVVVFIAFAHPFSHYERILRKMGCNLAVQRKNQRFLFLDMLMLECPDRNGGEAKEDGLLTLYGEIEKAVEIYSSLEGSRTITIMIDDVSLMEVAANGSSNHVLDFLHYCYTLKEKCGCSLVTLNHEDIYSSANTLPLILQLEYLADVIIKAEPLATGLASDVHGQLTLLNKGSACDLGSSNSKVRNFHFRVKENNVDYFYPGTQT